MRYAYYLLFSFNIFVVLAQNLDYKGYKVYNVKLKNEDQQNQLHLLKSDVIDFWRKPSWKHGIVGQVMVPPSHFDWFEGKLQEMGIENDVAVEDVYEFIAAKENSITKASRYVEDSFNFEGYYRYNAVLDYLNKLQETYSNSSTISLEVVENGRTEEDRPLVYLKVTSKNENNEIDTEKPVAVIEAGIIPREWVTIPSALYVVKKLLDGNNTNLLDEFEWIIIPVSNPDGYEYTHTNLRLWTKNRSTKSNLGFICPGANINRNFDISWSNFDSSLTPCSHLYAGINAFSEEETQFIYSVLNDSENRVQVYISLQNAGGIISYPWQYEKSASGMFRQHLLLGLDMVAAMIGSYISDLGSIAYGGRVSGTSTDYAREKDVLYTFNVDIIPVGNSGVMVPEEDIVDIAEDVWRAVSVVANGVNKYR